MSVQRAFNNIQLPFINDIYWSRHTTNVTRSSLYCIRH